MSPSRMRLLAAIAALVRHVDSDEYSSERENALARAIEDLTASPDSDAVVVSGSPDITNSPYTRSVDLYAHGDAYGPQMGDGHYAWDGATDMPYDDHEADLDALDCETKH
jgi:hypothetical protein